MVYNKVLTIEIETNTICNSFCPICIRYVEREEGLFLNPRLKNNQLLDVSIIDKIFSDPIVAEEVYVDLIGTAGEPIAHPKFLEIIEIILRYRPKANFNIHTNGGIRSPEFFRKLGKIMHDQPNASRVCFSIDGLEDTNHIYRVGVKWERIMENLRAYISTGANATWQFVIFDHNKHQIEEAKKLAFDMGCTEFETRENIDSEGIDNALASVERGVFIQPGEEKQKDFKFPMPDHWDYIDNDCITKGGIFINPEAQVYPCCMFSAAAYDASSDIKLKEAMYHTEGPDWHDLNLHSLTDIMNNQWWKWLSDGIRQVTNPCDMCIQQCGASKSKRAVSNINEISYYKEE
jgi:MoaA/NifB/PqqE/SkfB family radical SAM enzyme